MHFERRLMLIRRQERNTKELVLLNNEEARRQQLSSGYGIHMSALVGRFITSQWNIRRATAIADGAMHS